MGGFLNYLVKPLLKPLTRFIVGLIAIPVFHLILKKVIRVQELDAELEKDLEQWFRGSLLLLAATVNMEAALFSWVPGLFNWAPPSLQGIEEIILTGFRILLAIGVIEAMPDQELFSIIHPGPPKLLLSKKYGIFRELREKWRAILKGVVCQHINRSSPVFAILSAIIPDMIGWVCYGIAITQYLIIGLVTSRDRAFDVLSEFDRKVTIRRRELIDEFDISDDEVQAANEEKAEMESEEETQNSTTETTSDEINQPKASA